MIGISLISFVLMAAAQDNAEPRDIFDAARKAVATKQLARTPMVGFTIIKQAIDETPADGWLLVGFNLGVGKFGGGEAIHALQPIFRTPLGEMLGQQYGQFDEMKVGKLTVKPLATRFVTLQAKEGYAVGGATLRGHVQLAGMSLTFLKINGPTLDPTDQYVSEWVGDRTAGRESVLSSKSGAVVGIFGNRDDRKVSALGLVYSTLSGGAAVPAADPAKRPHEPVVPDKPAPAGAEPGLKPDPKGNREDAADNAPDWYPYAVAGAIGVPILGFLLLSIVRRRPTTADDQEPRGFERLQQPGPSGTSKEPPVTGQAMTFACGLSPEREAKVRAELSTGEELVWAGRPSAAALRFKGIGAVAVTAALMMVVGILVHTFFQANPRQLSPLSYILGAMVLCFTVASVATPWIRYVQARNTIYAITNRRALVWIPPLLGDGSMESYTPRQLQQLRRRDSWLIPGIGDLVFALEVRYQQTRSFQGPSWISEIWIRKGFLGVDNVDEVEKLLRGVLVDSCVNG